MMDRPKWGIYFLLLGFKNIAVLVKDMLNLKYV